MSRVRVLIADDRPIFRAGVQGMLRDFPEIDIVGEAVTGRQAVEHTRRLKPDVVLMDLNMPGSASTAGSGGGISAGVRKRRAAVVMLPSPPEPTAAIRDSGSDTIATSAAIAAVPSSARRRDGDAGLVSVDRSRALGRMNARATRNTAAPTAASMRLVTGSIRCGEKRRANTNAATHGRR